MCEQNRGQRGLSLQGPLPRTEAPTVISFNIISVMVTSVKNQSLLGLNMLCKCSCLAGPSSGNPTVYASQAKRSKQDIRREKDSKRFLLGSRIEPHLCKT